MEPTNKKWQAETVKHLVCLYELQPLLYNVNSPAYHNKMSRNVAIDTIKNELELITKIKFTTDEVVKKLNGLRTQFLNVERSRKKGEPSGSGSSSTSKPSWWLYESLQFLLPFTKKDRGVTNLVVDCCESAELEEAHFESDVSTIEQDDQLFHNNYDMSPSSAILSPDAGTSRTNSPHSILGSQQKNLSSRPLKRKRNVRERPGHEDILKETLEKIVGEKEDPIDLFTAWIGSELKGIKNNKILKLLKRKMVSLIEEAQDEDDLV